VNESVDFAVQVGAKSGEIDICIVRGREQLSAKTIFGFLHSGLRLTMKPQFSATYQRMALETHKTVIFTRSSSPIFAFRNMHARIHRQLITH
jgi:hypothetical protein